MITIQLTGGITEEPELRTVPTTRGETQVCNVRVAADNSRGHGLLDLTEYGPAGAAAAERLHKGDPIAFYGELDQREVDADNGRRQYTRAFGQIEFVGGRRNAPDAAPVAADDTADIPF